jgi:mono/diheme cytochrome c family protein
MTFVRLATLCLAVIGAAGCGDSPPQFSEPMTLGGQAVSAEVLNQGAKVYALRCASCHGNDGSGQGPSGRALQEQPRDFREADFKYKSTPDGALPTDADVEAVIRNGKVENGMPAWPGMSAEDRHAVVQYIKTFSPRWKVEETPSG